MRWSNILLLLGVAYCFAWEVSPSERGRTTDLQNHLRQPGSPRKPVLRVYHLRKRHGDRAAKSHASNPKPKQRPSRRALCSPALSDVTCAIFGRARISAPASATWCSKSTIRFRVRVCWVLEALPGPLRAVHDSVAQEAI